jgi:signal transduction histidine kinase
MGLPVAYSIVKKHGVFIEAQSIMGAGSLFYVYLPASDKKPQPVIEAPKEPSSQGAVHSPDGR